MDTIEFTQKSLSIADGSEIVLRENSKFKLVFLPKLIDDKVTGDYGVNGRIVCLRKKPNEDWERYTELNSNSLRAGEWTQMKLSTSETKKLIDGIQQCNIVLNDFGVESSRYSFFGHREKVEQLLTMFSDNEYLIDDLLEIEKSGLIEKVLKWISGKDDIEQVVGKLDSLNVTDLDRINSVVGLAKLKKVYTIWEENKDEDQLEKFWQDVLKEHSWILTQIFSTPTVMIDSEVYVGGKGFDNKGGKVVDFLLANPFSDDSVLIEIKTPQEKLLSSKEYRNNIYPINPHIAGAVSQVLQYKHKLQRTYRDIRDDMREQGKDVKFDSISPCCVVIAGRLDSLTTVPQKHSFEFYRKELGSVVLMTFDELFEKVKNFIDLLEQDK
ncbi:Shedu immune nuclease family protein [Exiguobacterium sp. s59]|uniref:Shedu immune nuclease family protein n=1 Tax=Exiguobacterium sp. s59 TaxID=2751269 RepID=UPI001BEA8B67|nr:Shedu immune nuclease family protein [Exiguobacterium sp. s59]